MIRKVPARRHNPEMQNFIYKTKTDPATRRKDEETVTRLARKVREELGLDDRSGNNGSN
jgi:hypothetical protein